MAGTLAAGFATTDSNGVASTEFTVTMQPGDNFVVAASTDQTYLNGVTINGTGLQDSSGNQLPTSQAKRTDMLSVWRRLHIEVDSMRESDGNFALGNIATTTRLRSHETVTINLNPTSPTTQLEENRFEGGRLVIPDGRSFPVVCDISMGDTCNTVNTVTVQNPYGSLITLFAGTQFQLYDDDDFNDNDGANVDGDTGEDIPEPDMALLTAGSDDVNTNIFAPAYVRPVYDIVDPRDNCLFASNPLSEQAVDLRPLFTPCWDSSNTNTDSAYWSVLVLGSYQDIIDLDNDPSTDGGSQGVVDEITGVTGDLEGSGALIFMEVHRTHEIPTYNPNPQDVTSLANTVGHEIGHLFSSEHGDGEIMGVIQPDGTLIITSSHFSSVTIRKIRGLMHP
jgi:hypothetical protein